MEVEMEAKVTRTEEAPPYTPYADISPTRTVNLPQAGRAFNWDPPPPVANTNHVVFVQPGSVPEPYVEVPDYYPFSAASIFLCLCLGFFSTSKSSKARRLRRVGKFQKAKQAAMTAKNTAMAAIIIGIICYAAAIVFLVGAHIIRSTRGDC